MPDNNEELLEGTYSLEEHRKEEEIDNTPQPPELPINYYSYQADDQVYKKLSSVGEFLCYVWFQHNFYDEKRTNGQHRIVIRGTSVESSCLDDGGIIQKFVGHSSGDIIFVDCIFRDNGVEYKSNRDLRDCARWISTVAGRYDGDRDKIYILDRDDETMHHVNINEEDLSMSVDSETLSVTLTYPRTAMMNGEKPSDLAPEIQAALVGDNPIADMDIGGGQIAISFDTKFNSGKIKWSEIEARLGGNYPIKLSEYYRGKAVVDIAENNKVPTSGRYAVSELREVATAVVYNCNGNFAHLNARWQIVNNESIWTNQSFNKRIVVTGHCGSLSQSQPAFRWNNSSGGQNEFRVNGRVYGYSGEHGNPNGGNGSAGGNSLHIASPIEMRQSDWSNTRISGAGGGGGGGGKGGEGGGGGHGSVKRCSGYFCWGSKKKCEKNGGKGGSGGNGGRGGKGKGYRWTGNSWNQTGRNEGKENGQGGQGGEGRGAGKGGNGGDGAQGGDWCGGGGKGDPGQKGENGREQEGGCGFRGDRNGKNGKNGGNGGNHGNFTTSHTGGFNLT